jgi:hypothetical protein
MKCAQPDFHGLCVQRAAAHDRTPTGAAPSPSGAADHGGNFVEHFVVFWEAADFVLAPDFFAVDVDVKDAPATFDQCGLDAELV